MKPNPKTNFALLIVICSFLAFLAFPLVQLRIATINHPVPNGIITLGGDPEREKYAFKLAKLHPNLPVWISSGSPPEYVTQLFTLIGAQNPLFLDYRAVDTVTNFTSLAHKLKQKGINHVYIVTSDYHMPRAQAIATIVLGSQGIAFTPIRVASTRNPIRETNWRLVRDVVRSYIWTLIGKTGASLGRYFVPRTFLVN